MKLRYLNCQNGRYSNTSRIFNYTEFILVRLCRKLLAYRNTLEYVPGTNQYWAMSVMFLAHGNNDLSLIWFIFSCSITGYDNVPFIIANRSHKSSNNTAGVGEQVSFTHDGLWWLQQHYLFLVLFYHLNLVDLSEMSVVHSSNFRKTLNKKDIVIFTNEMSSRIRNSY